MSLFKKKFSCLGVYSLYDPAVKEKNSKFSPPFFSPSDVLACSALCETLRRHNTSFEALLDSKFMRMQLWRCGSFDLSDGSLISKGSHKYRVCKLEDYFNQEFVRKFMWSLKYPTDEEISNNQKEF